MEYDYTQLTADISLLKSNYNFIDIFSIGKSVMEKDIPCIKIGNGDRKILLNGAHHALEYLTSAFLMKFIESYVSNYLSGADFFSYDTKNLYRKTSLFIVPMLNPDGVDVVINGLDLTNPYHRQLISIAGIHDFADTWQANINGVDLNHNYNANWNAILDSPAPSKYGGKHPESEPETKAMTNLIRREKFDMLLAFHSQGGEIYYDFDDKAPSRAIEIAFLMAQDSGYIACAPTGTASYGGCKDWFIKEFGNPGFTIEIGHGKNPLPMSMLSDIYEDNAKIILRAMSEA